MAGGLGAQILTWITGYYLQSQGHKVLFDLNYFSMSPRLAQAGEGVSIFPFELSYYDITLKKLSPGKFSKFLLKKIQKSSTLRKLPFIKELPDGSTERASLLKAAVTSGEWCQHFPIRQDTLNALNELGFGQPDYCAIHLRRGDYLNVASHLVDDDTILDLLLQQSDKLPKRLVFLSDSPIRESYFNEGLAGHGFCIEYRVGDDLFVSHALMRRANALIISNSQFSYSAAILRETEGSTFIPKQWFGDTHMELNTAIATRPHWIAF